MNTPFRELLWIELLFVACPFLMRVADQNWFGRPPLAVFGVMIVLMLCLAGMSLVGLLLRGPWACVVMVKQQGVMVLPRATSVILGAVAAALLGVWVVRIVFRL